MSIFRNSVVGNRQKVLPHFAVFLGSGGDFVGYFVGGEFLAGQAVSRLDVVHEGLLGLVAADVHHLDDGVFVRQIHVGNAAASGGMGSETVVVPIPLSFVGVLPLPPSRAPV